MTSVNLAASIAASLEGRGSSVADNSEGRTVLTLAGPAGPDHLATHL